MTSAERAGKSTGSPQRLTLQLDGFASDALMEESNRLGVSAEEIAKFALLYYLADIDSGRLSRRLPVSR